MVVYLWFEWQHAPRPLTIPTTHLFKEGWREGKENGASIPPSLPFQGTAPPHLHLPAVPPCAVPGCERPRSGTQASTQTDPLKGGVRKMRKFLSVTGPLRAFRQKVSSSPSLWQCRSLTNDFAMQRMDGLGENKKLHVRERLQICMCDASPTLR